MAYTVAMDQNLAPIVDSVQYPLICPGYSWLDFTGAKELSRFVERQFQE